MFKNFIGILLLCGLCACRPDTAATKKRTPKDTRPLYTVATDATYPPFEFYQRGKLIGLDIDLLNAIAENQGFRVQYYHHRWDGMFDQLNGKADIIASAVAITEESKQAATLSHEYYRTPYLAATLEARYLKGWQHHKIAAARNEDTIDDLQEEYGVREQNIVPADTVYLSLTDLAKGNAEVTVGDATVLQYYINSPTFRNYRFHTKILPSADPETDKLVFAVAKGNTALRDQINAGLAQLKRDGTLNKILHKWRQYDNYAAKQP